MAGINASLELIRRTRGGSWPTEPVTEEFNYVDLVWHECEFREGDSFSYAVYDAGGQYLGCCYLYPLGRRTPLTEELIAFDVDVSWWVTPGRLPTRPLRNAVRRASALAGHRVPVRPSVLLERGDPHRHG